MALATHYRTERLALRSAKVLAKLGFVEVGRDIKHCRARESDLPHVVLQLARKDVV